MKTLRNVIISGGIRHVEGRLAVVGDTVRLYKDDTTSFTATVLSVALVNCSSAYNYTVEYENLVVIRSTELLDQGEVVDTLSLIYDRVTALEDAVVTPESIGALSLETGGAMTSNARITFTDDSIIENGQITSPDGLATLRFSDAGVIGFGGVPSASLRSNLLYYEALGGTPHSINWNLGILYGYLTGISINYRNREIHNETGNIVIDYKSIPHFPLGATGTFIGDGSQLTGLDANVIAGGGVPIYNTTQGIVQYLTLTGTAGNEVISISNTQ